MKERKCSREYDWIVGLLIETKIKKIALFVNGVDYSKRDFNETCLLLEQDNYMPAYIGDEDGKVLQLHFDKVIID